MNFSNLFTAMALMKITYPPLPRNAFDDYTDAMFSRALEAVGSVPGR